MARALACALTVDAPAARHNHPYCNADIVALPSLFTSVAARQNFTTLTAMWPLPCQAA